jgi:hypothetical protein
MDESASGCWTNHHSIIQFKNQWYLFYHDKDYSPNFDKARSIRADSLSFNPDSTISKVIPTLRGIGITAATKEIQIDRYSKIADKGISISFIDTTNKFLGWKTSFAQQGAWIQYNTVDFGIKPLKSVIVKAVSTEGGILQIRVNSIDGPVIAEVKISKTNDWKINTAGITKQQTGIKHLFIVSKDGKPVDVDWVKFQ